MEASDLSLLALLAAPSDLPSDLVEWELLLLVVGSMATGVGATAARNWREVGVRGLGAADESIGLEGSLSKQSPAQSQPHTFLLSRIHNRACSPP